MDEQLQLFLKDFLRQPDTVSAELLPTPQYILDQINQEPSFMVDYHVKDHDCIVHGTVVIPNKVLPLINFDTYSPAAELIKGLILCSCPEGEARPTTCVVNQLHSYQGDPVNYYDPKLGRAVRIQGIDPASWEQTLQLHQLYLKLLQTPQVIYVNMEPNDTQEAKDFVKDTKPISFNIGYVNRNNVVPEPSVPINFLLGESTYNNVDLHASIVESTTKLVQDMQ